VTTDLTRYVVLLRAINVGRRTAPMAELRPACERAGFRQVQSYIASGNLVLSSADDRSAVEATIEGVIARDYGFHADAVARSAAEWAAYVGTAPFATERAARPAQIHLCLAKRTPAAGAAEALSRRATLGERFVIHGDALWVDFAGGVGRSKVTPGLLDRSVGAPVTVRNWNTVVKLLALAGGTTSGDAAS
jgi:uncharacterized protein (DUF1697 family)